jgi:hypothetical protein
MANNALFPFALCIGMALFVLFHCF